jgi:hypothetical protein
MPSGTAMPGPEDDGGNHAYGDRDEHRPRKSPQQGSDLVAGAGHQASAGEDDVGDRVDEFAVETDDECDGAAAHPRDHLGHADERTPDEIDDEEHAVSLRCTTWPLMTARASTGVTSTRI